MRHVIPVPEDLFVRLLGAQRARGHRDPTIEMTEVVWLHTDLGPSFYLARDGRVLVVDAFFLPAAPSSDRLCAKCGGARWWDVPAEAEHADLRKIICPECAGLGWAAPAGRP